MAYHQQGVTLDLDTDVTHQCSLHYTRDQHLIGIIEFSKPSYVLKWGDLRVFPSPYGRAFCYAIS